MDWVAQILNCSVKVFEFKATVTFDPSLHPYIGRSHKFMRVDWNVGRVTCPTDKTHYLGLDLRVYKHTISFSLQRVEQRKEEEGKECNEQFPEDVRSLVHPRDNVVDIIADMP
ncbi:hypothetical protein CBL_01776 [Carabus blaptoides fortunei]